jgi:quercetin dioxygenase-like cupin family protein
MSLPYTYVQDLMQDQNIPDDGILSRNVYADEHVKVVLFGFGPGQELSEHTASKPAILHFLDGRGRVTLGEDEHPVGPGSWMHMEAELKHSVVAETKLTMLLVLLKSAAPKAAPACP